MSQTILPTKVYRRVLQDEIAHHKPEHGTWYSDWGDYNDPANRERIARNILTARNVYEYPTRGLRDDLREYIALRIAPWLVGERLR